MSISISGSGAITGASTSYSFDQAVSIAGTITYEDVSNVDSVGIVTGRNGMHITSGSVGIGTDNPANKLDVIGGNIRVGKTSNGQFIGEDSSGTEKIKLDTNGDSHLSGGLVGINSTSPATALDIQSTKNSDGLTITKAGTRSAFLGHNGSGNEGLLILREGGTNKIQLYAETNQDSFINSGNLGIGTDNPNHKLSLHQSGTGTFDAINFITGNTNANGYQMGINSSGEVFHWNTTNSSIQFATNNTERLRIHGDGEVTVSAAGAGQTTLSVEALYTASGNVNIQTWARDGAAVKAAVKYVDSETMMKFGTVTNHNLAFLTNDTESARIDSSGRLMVGKTSAGVVNDGAELRTGSSDYAVTATADGHIPMIINRNSNDGGLLRFRQANTDEGVISVSGNDVTLSGATLSRWTQLPGNAERIEILRGTVLSNLDEMCEWGDEDNEQLNRMKVSDVEGDVNVAGVFRCWDDDDDTYLNDYYCAMTGDFVIRIAQGTTVARGDLLMSAGDGTAKPQGDDIVRSKTVAKVTSTTVSTTYSDGSYCVPCVLMAC